ncbi:MAG: Hsp20/alpha crystallin family protein [Deltaproteobacteria bacterium]|nr:Hsp20/alpha crystallin family protein [Deltaproteobacteria bacterium]
MNPSNPSSSPTPSRKTCRRVAPTLDAFESPDAWLFRFDVPGVADEGLTLRFEAGRLELDAAQTLTEGWAEPLRYIASVPLPEGVDVEAIDASLASGVLTVKVGKSPTLRSRLIEVKKVN